MKYFKEFKLCKKVVKEIGDFLLEQDSILIDSSDGKDIKLELDRKCEEILFKKIVAKFEYKAIGEESGYSDNFETDHPYWIIDPIDGSMNFSRKNPICCISVAFWMNNEPIFGVIYDFNRDEMFSGYVGENAWLNDTIIQKKKTLPKSKSILATGFPTYMSDDEATLKNLISKIQKFKKIRMIGTAALSLAYVACNRFDAYYEENIKIWDVAAGIAINKSLSKNIIFKGMNNETLMVFVS